MVSNITKLEEGFIEKMLKVSNMEKGTYLLSEDNTGSKYQQWYYNYLVRISNNGIERITIGKNSSYCEVAGISKDEISKEQLMHVVPLSTSQPNERVSLMKMGLGFGERFSHIYRPLFTSSFSEVFFNPTIEIPIDYYIDPKIENLSEYTNHMRQLDIILSELYNIFKVVEPESKNLNTYGNAIRNVIILSCTEVDALFKHILKANGVEKKDDIFTTQDYIKIKDILQLGEFVIAFSNIVTLNDIAPFRNWNAPKTTQTLTWYDSYNKIKHDRIENFKMANLKTAIESVFAFATLLIASFGYRNDIWNEKIGKIIKVKKEPFWLLKDFYLPPVIEREEVYVNHPDICKGKTNKKVSTN